MRWLLWAGTLCLWAQVESRERGSELPKPSPKTPAAPKPAVTEVSYITISGTASDSSQSPLTEARVWIVDQKSGKVLGETQADKRGNFGFAIPKVESVILRISKDDKFYEKAYTLEEIQRDELKVVLDPQ
ncbi:MAG: carboxypeptidase-like regulatory domain-containing protein [Bacteroidia bacterium]